MVEVTGDYYVYPLIPTTTVVGEELKTTASKGDKIYAKIVEYENRNGQIKRVNESVVLRYYRYQEDTSTHLANSDISCVLFRQNLEPYFPDHVTYIRSITFDVHKLVTQDGTKYEFNEFGELSAVNDGGSGSDTKIYDR